MASDLDSLLEATPEEAARQLAGRAVVARHLAGLSKRATLGMPAGGMTSMAPAAPPAPAAMPAMPAPAAPAAMATAPALPATAPAPMPAAKQAADPAAPWWQAMPGAKTVADQYGKLNPDAQRSLLWGGVGALGGGALGTLVNSTGGRKRRPVQSFLTGAVLGGGLGAGAGYAWAPATRTPDTELLSQYQTDLERQHHPLATSAVGQALGAGSGTLLPGKRYLPLSLGTSAAAEAALGYKYRRGVAAAGLQAAGGRTPNPVLQPFTQMAPEEAAAAQGLFGRQGLWNPQAWVGAGTVTGTGGQIIRRDALNAAMNEAASLSSAPTRLSGKMRLGGHMALNSLPFLVGHLQQYAAGVQSPENMTALSDQYKALAAQHPEWLKEINPSTGRPRLEDPNGP